MEKKNLKEKVFNRYQLQEQPDECGATIYQILDTSDMEIVDTYDDKQEAEDALNNFWNSEVKI